MTSTRRTADLRPHPDNHRIYGDEADDDLSASVREKGILSPLLVTRDDRVISGHRRLHAARNAGLVEVPVAVFESDDELDILEALVHTNKSRSRTNEQKAREAQTLMEVERRRAEARQRATRLAGKEKDGSPRTASVVETFPPPTEEGKTRDLVGERLGLSGKTVEKAVKVVEAIDRLEQDGEAEAAEAIRGALNRKSIEAAHRAVVKAAAVLPPGVDAAPGERPLPLVESLSRDLQLWDEAKAAVAAVRRTLQRIADTASGADLREESGCVSASYNPAVLRDLAALVSGCRPRGVGCPQCDGSNPRCPICKGRGWVCRRVYLQLSEDGRAKLAPLVGD